MQKLFRHSPQFSPFRLALALLLQIRRIATASYLLNIAFVLQHFQCPLNRCLTDIRAGRKNLFLCCRCDLTVNEATYPFRS